MLSYRRGQMQSAPGYEEDTIPCMNRQGARQGGSQAGSQSVRQTDRQTGINITIWVVVGIWGQ